MFGINRWSEKLAGIEQLVNVPEAMEFFFNITLSMDHDAVHSNPFKRKDDATKFSERELRRGFGRLPSSLAKLRAIARDDIAHSCACFVIFGKLAQIISVTQLLPGSVSA